VIDQTSFGVQPVHLANATSTAAVTIKTQVTASVLFGIIFIYPKERIIADRSHAGSVMPTL